MQRIEWLDSVRGLSILFVMLIHAFLTNDGIVPEVNSRIYSFIVQIFFVISGFLYRDRSFTEFFATRINRLLKPYFVGQIIVTGLSLLLVAEMYERAEDYIIGIFAADLTLPVSNSLADYPLWFLPCLFVAEIIFFAVNKITQDRLIILIIVSIFLSTVGINLSTFVNLPWGVDIALTSQIFLTAGYILRLQSEVEKITVLQMFFIVTLFLITTEVNLKIDVAYRIYNNHILFFVDGIIGSLIIFWISRHFSIKWLNFIGRHTLILLIIHVPIFFCIELLIQMLGFNYSDTIFCWLKLILTLGIFTVVFN